jgi:hypothetical protein
MKRIRNIGIFDRVLRLVVALFFLVLAYWVASWVILVIALFVLFEALVGWCLLYQIFGKNSCSIKKQ